MSSSQPGPSPTDPAGLLLRIRRPKGGVPDEIYLESVRTIGRSEENTVVLKHETATDRVHARLTTARDGAIWLDCEPGNSVIAGGGAVAKLRLGPGVTFRIGGTEFECVAGRGAPATPGGGPRADRTDDLVTLLDEWLVLLRESAGYHRGRADVIAVLGAAEVAVRRVRCRLQQGAGSFTVALVGHSETETSSLVDALLGLAIAPPAAAPPRACPLEFRHGPDHTVKHHASHRLLPRVWSCDGPGEVRSKLAELAAEGGASRVVVTVPSPLLAAGLVLAAPPAVGGPSAAAAGFHEASLASYLHATAAHVSWVVGDPGFVAARGQGFYRDALSQVCDELVAVGGGAWPPDESARFRRHFHDVFTLHAPRFHFLTIGPGTPRVGGFRDRITALANASRGAEAVAGSLRELAADLGAWLGGWRDEWGRPLRSRWRPDSWERWRAVLAGDDLKELLTQDLQDR